MEVVYLELALVFQRLVRSPLPKGFLDFDNLDFDILFACTSPVNVVGLALAFGSSSFQ